MSNTELTGPIRNINFCTEAASQLLGCRRNSSSTWSQGRAVQDTSYTIFKSRIWIASIGRKGRNTEAARTENIFPKLDAAVSLMYFIIFA